MKRKQMSRWDALKAVIKPKNLIIIIVLIASNSFAWFIYASQVRNDMSAHVRAWNVLFENSDSPIIDYVNVNIESMYPGMEEFVYDIKARNKSEVDAMLTYTILEARVLDTTYLSVEGRAEKGEEANEEDLTSEQLEEKLKTEYPFAFNMSITTRRLDKEMGEADYKITANWPFEGGNDIEDTKWGKQAEVYKKDNPTSPSIILRIKISISQIN